MTTAPITITAATCKTGCPLAQALLDQGHAVRVVGRSAERLEAFRQRGAEVAMGDPTDADFLTRAFAGSAAVFTVVPSVMDVVGIRDHQIRIGRAYAEALQRSGVQRVVNLSSLGAQRARGLGPVDGLHVVEELLDAVDDLDLTHLRPTFLFENHLGAIQTIHDQGVYASVLRADQPIPMIAARDITAVAIDELTARRTGSHFIRELHGAAAYTMSEVTRALGAAVDIPHLRYEQVGYDEAHAALVTRGYSAAAADGLLEFQSTFNRSAPAIQPRSALTTSPTTLAAFASEVFAPAFHASTPATALSAVA